MDDTEGPFQINLNHEGNDIAVTVEDLNTAVLLLNDPDAAITFLKTNYPHIIPSTSRAHQQTAQQSQEDIEVDVIWTKKKPSQIDLEATKQLLYLREKMEDQFIDKKTNKTKLWNKIGQELKKQFNIGDSAGERCRQKFANLTKAYLHFIKNQKTTGSKKLELPPFFEEMHSILGSKHKTSPSILEDSMEINDEMPEQDELPKENFSLDNQMNETPSTSKDFQNRFTKATKRVKPFTTSELILKEIQEDRKARSEEISFLKDHLKTTEKQRDRLLDILANTFKKRKRGKESDDDSD